MQELTKESEGHTLQKSPLMFLREQSKEQQYREHRGPLGLIIQLNRERGVQKLRDKLLDRVRPKAPLIPGKGTLILAARCQDGAIIGSDRKIIRGGETEYTNKVFELDLGGKVLFAAEGLTGIRDDFFLLLDYEIRRRRGVDTLYEVKVIVEDIISELTQRYQDRIRELTPIGVLMGGLDKLSGGRATLYYVHSAGYGELIPFLCSGHGGPYGYSLAKFLCGSHIAPNLSTSEVARRVAFTIAYVAEDVNSTVGGQPQVVILKDDSQDVEYLSQDVIREQETRAKEVKSNLAKVLGLHLL